MSSLQDSSGSPVEMLSVVGVGGGGTSKYDWIGVLRFLQDQYKELSLRETETQLERQQLLEKNAMITTDLKSQE